MAGQGLLVCPSRGIAPLIVDTVGQFLLIHPPQEAYYAIADIFQNWYFSDLSRVSFYIFHWGLGDQAIDESTASDCFSGNSARFTGFHVGNGTIC